MYNNLKERMQQAAGRSQRRSGHRADLRGKDMKRLTILITSLIMILITASDIFKMGMESCLEAGKILIEAILAGEL